MKRAIPFALLLSLNISLHAHAKPSAPCDVYSKAIAKGLAAQKLHQFLDVQWKNRMSEWPEYATYLGAPGVNDKWRDLSPEAQARREANDVCELQTLKKIPRGALSGENKLTLDLALYYAEQAIAEDEFGGKYLILNQMDGIQITAPDVLSSSPTATVKDYEDRIARLNALPVYVDQAIAVMREGLRKKITPVKMFLEKVTVQFDAVVSPAAKDGLLYEPFKDVRAEMTAAAKTDLQKRALDAVETKALPAMKKLRDFIVKEYIPGARTETAMSSLPNGTAWYAFLVRKQTTTSMTPDQLHELGLKEVARIKEEMEAIKEHSGFKGTLPEFNRYLQTDAKFFYTDGRALLGGYRDIAKRIDAELPRFFRRLPRLPYGVREMAEYKAKDAPTAYYQGGTIEGGRPGYFEANLYDLKARPIWGMEALTLHEAVPGHHLQISIAQELTDLPEFRKNEGPTAFVEGWALYAERLGEDMGFYQDDFAKYGELAYEMWRAVRLVVDTGLHAKGWSREKALAYFMELIPKSQMESENEINRYISDPGQALAYKIGQLKFLELREKARAKLGAKFDIRAYHDEVLSHGAIPMNVLEQLFGDWLKKQEEVQSKPGPQGM